MTLREIAALMRRHLLAATVVLVIAAGVGYDIGSTPPLYSESATVVFTPKSSLADSRSSASFVAPLIATEVMMAETMMSSSAQSQVRAAGGTASFQFAPSNLYSLQYPDYDEPDATLTATSQRPADVQRTFMMVLKLLSQRLAAMQARVPLRSRVQDLLVGDTGIAVQPAASTRVFGGLALLTLVGLFMVANFLDRRGPRPGVLRPVGRKRRLAAG